MYCLSIRYVNRLAEAGIDMSVGSVGDSCDNALAETVSGLFKTEAVKHPRPVEKQRPTRMGDHETGALMQQGPASRHHRLPEPGRKGERMTPAKQRA